MRIAENLSAPIIITQFVFIQTKLCQSDTESSNIPQYFLCGIQCVVNFRLCHFQTPASFLQCRFYSLLASEQDFQELQLWRTSVLNRLKNPGKTTGQSAHSCFTFRDERQRGSLSGPSLHHGLQINLLPPLYNLLS